MFLRALAVAATLFMLSANAYSKVSLSEFVGTKELVNSFLVDDGKDSLLIDAQIDNENAKELVKVIEKSNTNLKYIFVTHSHPDHYMGLAYILDMYPQAQVLVANEDIKNSIIANTVFMQENGFLSVPEMHTDKFDYEAALEVMKGNKIYFPSGTALLVQDDYLSSETGFISTLYSPDLNALFASDLAYNKVFPWLGEWMGAPVGNQEITNWKFNLEIMERRWGELKPVVYAGHGEAGGFEIFADLIEYMEIFQFVVRTSGSFEEAYNKLELLFPEYSEAELFLNFSLKNHIPGK